MMRELPIFTSAVDVDSFKEAIPRDLSVEKIVMAAVLLVLCIVLIKLLLKLSARALSRSKLDTRIQTVITGVIKAVLVFVAILLIAETLGVNTTSLLAILSVAGLAVSLSIQDTLSNLASALMILSSKPFKLGDFIEVKGNSGTVEQIGIVYTTIATPDNRHVCIPNRQITSNEITNYTAVGKRRVEINLSASYDAPIETVKAALIKAAEHPARLADEPVFARVSGYGDSAIAYTLRLWAKPEDYWDVYFDVLEACKAAFDEAGVEMTYPHLNVHTVT